jgi:outer membrane immunogenic protein
MRARGKSLLAGATALALSSASALAADVPIKAPAIKAAAPVYDWGGWYGGVNTGVGVSQSGANDGDIQTDTDLGATRFTGGAQAGYNWHFAPRWVAGIEGDTGHLGIKRSLEGLDSGVFGVTAGAYGTIRGRIGYTNGPSLFYVSGGVAFVNIKNNFDDPVGGTFASKSRIATGWTMGGGIETMLRGNWSAKAEYLYIDAGDQEVFNPSIFGDGSIAPFRNRFHVFRYGLNYKFGTPSSVSATGDEVGFDWSGFYAGANTGSGLSQSTGTTDVRGSEDLVGTGLTAGMQAGYNFWLHPSWIAGVEGDVGYLGVARSLPVAGSAVFGAATDWYGTIRGRLGHSTGPALLYVTGGAAFVKVKNNSDSSSAGTGSASRSTIATGWTVGGGIEAALGKNWSAKTEYLYIDAGEQVFGPDPFGGTARFDNRFHVFRFGLNYRFGG